MKSGRKFLLIVILGVLTAAGLGGCAGTGAVEGYIYGHADARGTVASMALMITPAQLPEGDYVPVEGIAVETTGPTRRSAVTDSTGYFRISGLHHGTYRLSTSGDRFVSGDYGPYLVEDGIVTPCGDLAVGSFYTVIVGINDYLNLSSFYDLDCAEADANLIYSSLVSRNTIAKESRLLLGASATKAGIQSAIQAVGQLATPQDVFVFYFSGHGSQDSIHEYICPQDMARDGGNVISDTELADWVSQYIHARQSIFIFDSCFSGGMFKTTARGLSQTADGFTAMARNLSSAGHIVATASNKDEYSYEESSLGHGYFTYYFDEGLRTMKADSSRDGAISPWEAFRYTIIAVGTITGWAQNPQFFAGEDADRHLPIYRP